MEVLFVASCLGLKASPEPSWRAGSQRPGEKVDSFPHKLYGYEGGSFTCGFLHNQVVR